MALKIRLRQQGRTKRPFYRLVVTDARDRRDGKYIEALGWYNPVEANVDNQTLVKGDRVSHWLSLGAQLTEKAEYLVKRVQPAVMQAYNEKQRAKKSKIASKRKEKKAAK